MSTPTPRTLTAGLYDDIPAEMYHADPCVAPSLSSGVARTIVEKTPAHAYLEHVRLGGRKSEPTSDMILGSAVHALLAGGVAALELEFSVGNYDDYKSKAAQTWRDDVKLSGKTPILEKNVQRAEKIANALREKAAAGLTTDPFSAGKPEVTAVWEEDGVWARARYDRLILDPTFFADVWDWKTTNGGVTVDALERSIIDRGYHVQAAHYLRGLAVLAPQYRGRFTFTLAFVETEPPYAVRRVPIGEGWLQIGQMLVDRAFARWRECLAANHWPDESGESLFLTPPPWYVKKLEDAA